MATINIVGDLVLDQSAGLQDDDVAISVDAITGDISGGLNAAFLTYLNGLTLSAEQLAFADTAEAASQIGLVTVSPAPGENVVELEFAPLTNVSSGQFTVDGDEIFLTTVQNGSAVEAWADGNLVAAFYIIPNVDNTSATVQMITFEAIDHPLNPEPDDRVDFSDVLKVRALVEASTPIGDDINVDDDGPDVNTSGAGPDLTVDESFLGGAGATTTGNFLANFPNSFGTDGAGTLTFALGIPADATDSGFIDTASQEHIFLYKELDGSITGRVGDGGLADANGAIAFTVSVNTTTAVVTLTQSLAMVHNVPGNGTVPAGSYDEAISLAATLVTLTAHSEDADGDDDSATLNIGDNLFFKDDGPSISAPLDNVIVTVDESTLAIDDTKSFATQFTSGGGKDGSAGITYALSVVAGASGLTDTLSGQAINLSLNGSVVEGKTAVSGDLVFTVSVDASGQVTLNQIRAVIHDPNNGPNDTETLDADNLIKLTATITDKDGDTASAVLNIGQNLLFTDDAPTITAPFDGVPGGAAGDRETLHNVVSPPADAATGVFGYNIGNDIPDYNGADDIAGNSDDESDFVDGNLNVAGVQLALSGFVGSATPPITGSNGTAIFANANNVPAAPAYATLVSEDANSATFNFTFHYDKDPITTGIQDATAGGQLIFDKVNDTYSITLNDVIDGFAFDVVHTNQDFARNPNTNAGHPGVVVAQLTPNGDPNPFLVQFTGNNSPFSFSQNGEGSTNDTTFDGANHDMATSAVTTWVSATQGENGVAGDTIQKGELLTLRFFKEPAVLNDPNVDVDPVTPGIQHERTEPTTTASGIVLKFDGIGNSEDLVVILDLVDTKGTASTADDTESTVALNIQNSDFLKGGAVVPSPYNTEFSLSGYSGSNNDALLIIEQNDYTANANVFIQGVQIMQSANGLTGTGINFVNTTGAGGGSLAGAQQALDPTDNDVLKIVDIGFVQTTSGTLNASLDFAVQLADADGDVTPTPAAHILVDVVA